MTTEQEAIAILRRRAADLSIVTGKPSEQIFDEMVDTELTPGQWAELHGLDPMTFQPRDMSDDGAHGAMRRIWNRMRLDGSAEPPEPVVLAEITEILKEFAQNEYFLFEEGAPTLLELQQQNALLAMLHDRGARMDADWLNGVLRQLDVVEVPPFLTLQTQEAWDERQRRAVTDRQGD